MGAALAATPGGRSWISHAGEITFTARLAGREPALRSVLASNALSRFMSAIVGPPARLYFDHAVYKKPGCDEDEVVPWHRDNGHNPKVPADYVTFWILLTDTNLDNGTILLQPGRHNEGPLPHWRTQGGYLVYEDGARGGVPIEIHRGDVVAFSSLLPHATGPNATPEVRKPYIAGCVPVGTKLIDGTACEDPIYQPVLLGAAL